MKHFNFGSFLIRCDQKMRVIGRGISLMALLCSLIIVTLCVVGHDARFYRLFRNSAPMQRPSRAIKDWTQPLKVHYLDVGRGDCTLIQCSGDSVLIDGGGEDTVDRVIKYLENQGVKHLEFIVCTEDCPEKAGGLFDIYRHFGADVVFVSSYVYAKYDALNHGTFAEEYVNSGKFPLYQLNRELHSKESKLYPLMSYSWLDIGSAQLDILAPNESIFTRAHGHPKGTVPMVMRLSHGSNSFLFASDTNAERENNLILQYSKDLDSNVLKQYNPLMEGSKGENQYKFVRGVAPVYRVSALAPADSKKIDKSIPRTMLAVGSWSYSTALHGTFVFVSDRRNLYYTLPTDI